MTSAMGEATTSSTTPAEKLEVTIVCGCRFQLTQDGALWTERSSPYDYEFWRRYLDVYDGVCLIARAKSVEAPSEDARPVTGPAVRAECIPDFHSPSEFLARTATAALALKRRVDRSRVLHLQCPSPLANVVYFLMDRRRPFAVEVKGDPYDSFAPGAFPHPLRAVYRWLFPRVLARQCAAACAVTYVTSSALQRRYPSPHARFSNSFSNVALPDEAFVIEPRQFRVPPHPARIISVGMMKQLNKGTDLLISAVAVCVRQGHDVVLSLVGDGEFRPELQAQARREGVECRVRFLGRLERGREVREALDSSDLFVLPSRQEGVPRAALEAMARSLPCIGSDVGGFPEILPANAIVPREDARALADRIMSMIADPDQLTVHAGQNLERSRSFHENRLRQHRFDFFSAARAMAPHRGSRPPRRSGVG